MNYDVVSLGELLIDFISCGESAQGNPVFEANPGGAVVNVLAMLAKLGKKTGFIGKVGADMFGQQLAYALSSSGTDISGLVFDTEANTTLAFVQNFPDGDREFSFYRNPGADTLLLPDEVDMDMISDCRIFHFGTLSLTHQPVKDATRKAIAAAKEMGKLLSFDPNLRPPLWETMDEAHSQIDWGCSVCDILKIADDELTFLSGYENTNEGIGFLRSRYPHMKLILLTKGADGSEAYIGDCHVSRPAFKVKAIDTTGAGDTFFGCCLAYILDCGIDNLCSDSLTEMLTLANAAASLIATRKGALLSMPTREEIDRALRSEI